MQNDIIIIGGGIVGLASAYNLLKQNPNLTLVILEKENAVAAHQTGHNSGVIHSGIYYKPGSLKAENCITGYKMLIDFCNQYGIPYELCGKLIVAVNEKEIVELDKLYNRGLENGLTDIKYVSADQIKEYEPNLNGVKAVSVPYTGIIDYTVVCEKLAELVIAMGGEIHLNHKVEDIDINEAGAHVSANGKTFHSKLLVNCAGLYCDKVAELAGEKADTRIIPFRGEYYMLKPEKRNLVRNLIYPVPDPNFPFLGVHFTRMIDGGVEAGPNAVFAFKREGYHKSDVDLSLIHI